MISKLLTFTLLFLTQQLVCSASSHVKLDTVVIQLRSESDSHNSALLKEVLHMTTRFLDDYFAAYYVHLEPSGYFEEAQLQANSFGIQGGDKSYINTIEFDGVLLFNSTSTPPVPFIKNLLTNAFTGMNLQIYLEKLLSSQDTFLSHLTEAYIEIDGAPVTSDILQNPAVQNAVSHKARHGLDLQQWTEIAIYATAGVVGALFVLAFFCLCRCCCGKRQVQDEGNAITIKKIEIPTPTGRLEAPQPQSRRNRPRQSSQRHGRSHSPEKSVASHDSSLFTYNPVGVSRDIGTLSLGSISNFNIETPNFDLEAWQQKNTISSFTPAPFGQDISAIEDGDSSVLRARGSQPTKKKSSFSLEQRHSDYRQYAQMTYNTSTIRETSGRESSLEEGNSTSSNVINDLKNLSLQIDKHRSKVVPFYRA